MCDKGALLGQLKQLVHSLENEGNGGTAQEPFAQVCFACPPPCEIPICPCPVKPLQLPCAGGGCQSGGGNPGDALVEKVRNDPKSRYDNFYNNYNIDWHSTGYTHGNHRGADCTEPRKSGATMDGQSPCCDDYLKGRDQQQQRNGCDDGCPTGFKPCKMALKAPPGCSPCGVWTAQVQKCPVKPGEPELDYAHQPCERPCCLHWEDKGGPCLYDDPCKAHCFNHPPGIKPSGRFP